MHSISIHVHISLTLLCHYFTQGRTISKRHISGPGSNLGFAWSYQRVKKNEFVTDTNLINKIELHNLRDETSIPELATSGFTYVHGRDVSEIGNLSKFSEEFKEAMQADSVQLVKDLTKAKEAVCVSYGHRGVPNQNSMKPFPTIHSDLSPKGARFKKRKIQDALLKSKDPRIVKFGKCMKKGKRFLILNVWRPLETVKDNPLAICDWRTLKKEDALEFRVRPTHIGNSVQAWKYGPHQKWFYLPNQEPHEVFVFMQHDSKAQDKHGINVPHTSVALDGQADATPTRISYEFRIVALMED